MLGLPRGGVEVADEVARALGAPLDMWIVRKLGAPGQPEGTEGVHRLSTGVHSLPVSPLDPLRTPGTGRAAVAA